MGRRFERAQAARRSIGIHAFIGPNGSGKSLAAVSETLPSLAAGRPVLSTVRLLDTDNPRPCDDESCKSEAHGQDGHRAAHPLWTPLSDWSQLMDWRNGDVLLDEVTGVASSRESHGLPPAVANLLVQLRRRDVVLRWTAPAWPRADKIIRETTQAVTVARAFMPVKAVDGTLWRPRRLFHWTTYDARSFDEWSTSLREKADVLVKSWCWGPTSLAFRGYDTLDQVLSINSVTDSGRCVDCGGTRRAPECSCSDYVDDRAARRAAAPQRAKPRGAARRALDSELSGDDAHSHHDPGSHVHRAA